MSHDNGAESNLILDKCIVDNQIVEARLIYVLNEMWCLRNNLTNLKLSHITGSISTNDDMVYP